MSGEHEAPKQHRPFYQTLTVDVDIDASVLEEHGYHHEDDCPATPTVDDMDVPDNEINRRALSDWHDQAHGLGLGLWASCVYEPCNLLTDEFRKTP
jgi:hypothetical protein